MSSLRGESMSVLDGIKRIAKAVYDGFAWVGETLLRRPGTVFYLAIVILTFFIQAVAVFLLVCILAAAHRNGGVR